MNELPRGICPSLITQRIRCRPQMMRDSIAVAVGPVGGDYRGTLLLRYVFVARHISHPRPTLVVPVFICSCLQSTNWNLQPASQCNCDYQMSLGAVDLFVCHKISIRSAFNSSSSPTPNRTNLYTECGGNQTTMDGSWLFSQRDRLWRLRLERPCK